MGIATLCAHAHKAHTTAVSAPAATSIPSDVFDRALALAKEFAAQEVAGIERSYTRLIAVLSFDGAFLLALITFFGLRTVKEAQQSAEAQAIAEVSAQLPRIVKEETQAQYAQQNVGKVIQEQVARDAAKDIDGLIRERIAPLVAEQVAAQRPQLEKIARRNVASQVQVLARQQAAMPT